MSGGANPTAALIAALWQRNQPVILERVEMLARAADAATTGTLDKELRSEAHAAAHKLAGALGMYGRGEAGAIASQIEQLLEGEEAVNAAELTALATNLQQSLNP